MARFCCRLFRVVDLGVASPESQAETAVPMTDPWCWYINANIWGIWMVNVTIYSSTMDPSWGMDWLWIQSSLRYVTSRTCWKTPMPLKCWKQCCKAVMQVLCWIACDATHLAASVQQLQSGNRASLKYVRPNNINPMCMVPMMWKFPTFPYIHHGYVWGCFTYEPGEGIIMDYHLLIISSIIS